MATRIERRFPATGTRMLDRILSAPALVHAVRELPAPVLARLIDRVGLEDAGELVALAGPEQLHAMLDEHVWHGAAGGAQEQFEPARFMLWLEVMSEAGDELVVRTLRDLPQDVLSLAVQHLVLVLNMDELAERLAGDPETAAAVEQSLGAVPYEEWEEFALIPRDVNSWDVLWSALLALDREDHALLRDVFERCAFVTAADAQAAGGVDVLLDGEAAVLEARVADERDERRAARGYVSAPDARAFLSLCRQDDYPNERDPITRAYFRRVAPAAETEVQAAPSPGVAPDPQARAPGTRRCVGARADPPGGGGVAPRLAERCRAPGGWRQGRVRHGRTDVRARA